MPFEFGDEPFDTSSMTTVNCAVTKGDLPVEILWLFNGNPIITSDGIIITKSGQRVSMLTIESVNSDHAGNYSCLARNKAGEVSYSSQLRVLGLFTSLTFDSLLYMNFLYPMIHSVSTCFPVPSSIT